MLSSKKIITSTEILTKIDMAEIQILIDQINPRPHKCYNNARQLAILSKGKYKYWEGAIWQGLNNNPAHAWNMLDDIIVDISVYDDGTNFCLGELRPNWKYAGVGFDYKSVVDKDKSLDRARGLCKSDPDSKEPYAMLTKEQEAEMMIAVLDKNINQMRLATLGRHKKL